MRWSMWHMSRSRGLDPARGARRGFVAGVLLLALLLAAAFWFALLQSRVVALLILAGIVLAMVIGVNHMRLQAILRQQIAGARDEDALRERFAMTGTLTASLIDSISQPLSVVSSHAEAAARWLDRAEPDWGEARVSVAEIVDASRRMGAIIERGRNFLDPDRQPAGAVDIPTLLAGVLVLLERELVVGRITLRCNIEANLPPVVCDAARIEQVAITLLMRGVEAIRARDDALRVLELTAERSGEAEIRIGITDHGLDMARAAPEIGLCRGVIEAHGGRLSLAGAAGRGSTVAFTLPVGSARNAGLPARHRALAAGTRHGGS